MVKFPALTLGIPSITVEVKSMYSLMPKIGLFSWSISLIDCPKTLFCVWSLMIFIKFILKDVRGFPLTFKVIRLARIGDNFMLQLVIISVKLLPVVCQINAVDSVGWQY